MIPENRIPSHPGEILLEEFLKPLDLTQVALARHLGIPTQRINEIVRGKRYHTRYRLAFSRGIRDDTAALDESANELRPGCQPP